MAFGSGNEVEKGGENGGIDSTHMDERNHCYLAENKRKRTRSLDTLSDLCALEKPRLFQECSRTMKWQCPICRKPTDSESSPDFPFCSERCRLTDLGNWASEKYKISEPVIDESTPDEPQQKPPQKYVRKDTDERQD